MIKKIFSCLILLVMTTFMAGAGNLFTAGQMLGDYGFELSSSNGTFPSSGYWKSAWLGQAGAVCTTTSAHSGNNGLWQYTGSSSSDWWSGPYQRFSASSGEVYYAYAWIRTPSGYGWVSGSKALVRVSFRNSSDAEIAYYDSPALTTSNTTWAKYEVTTQPAPAGTSYVRFIIYLEKPQTSGQSIVNFDDCYLELSSTAPAAMGLSESSVNFGLNSTSKAFQISNVGSGTLSWSISDDQSWISASPTSGSTTTEKDTITVTVSRSGLNSGDYSGNLRIAPSYADVVYLPVYMNVGYASIPTQPSIARSDGYKLLVQRRLPDGSLDKERPFVVKGFAWSPASVGMEGSSENRRAAFVTYYAQDSDLIQGANANCVYTFLDFGTGSNAQNILDYLYKNNIMAIVTVDEDGNNNTSKITEIVNAYKNHPAILMWAVGNEWNINLYHEKFTNIDDAAEATENAAIQIKALDANHPVASIYGEIDFSGQPLSKTEEIVNVMCPNVDVWGLNIYRGPNFGTLFEQWKSITSNNPKPMFLSEFGVDAFGTTSYWPVVGSEEQDSQASWNRSMWDDIEDGLSADDEENVCFGGTVFEWNDEWWKVGAEYGGSSSVHDNGGWESGSFPDRIGNEEWFGVVDIYRNTRKAYQTLKDGFSYEVNLDVPFYEEENTNYTGAAAAKMLLSYVLPKTTSNLSQTDIYNYGRSNNLPENSSLQELDPNGMTSTLNYYCTKNINYTDLTFTSADDLLNEICFRVSLNLSVEVINKLVNIKETKSYPGTTSLKDDLLGRNIHNISLPEVKELKSPVIIPTKRDYAHWLILKGIATSHSPQYLNRYVVYGFWVNDPAADGVGEDYYMSVGELKDIYLKSISSSDKYNGLYVAIAGPAD